MFLNKHRVNKLSYRYVYYKWYYVRYFLFLTLIAIANSLTIVWLKCCWSPTAVCCTNSFNILFSSSCWIKACSLSCSYCEECVTRNQISQKTLYLYIILKGYFKSEFKVCAKLLLFNDVYGIELIIDNF